MTKTKIMLTSIVLTLIVTSSWCATIEVIQSDPNAPYQKIGDAIKAAKEGDTVLVHPGVYDEIELSIAGITLRSLRGPEVTIIQSSESHYGYGIQILSSNTDKYIASIIGFTIRQFGKSGVAIETNNQSVLIANNLLTSNANNGISIGEDVPSSIRVINNIIAYNGYNGLNTNTWTNYPNILNNIVYKNALYGFNGVSNSYSLGNFNVFFGNKSGGKYYCNIGVDSLEIDPLIDSNKSFRFANANSPLINKGQEGDSYNDPDGSRNDIGAYGGPYAKDWWRDPFTGPTISNMIIDPPQVRPGETFTIRVTAKTFD